MTQAHTDLRSAAKAATARVLRSYVQRALDGAARSKFTSAEITKYALISTPRVGSTMLCRKLHETARLGWPEEWINDRYLEAFTDVAGKIRADAYVDTIIRGTATGNGVFGINFHIQQYHLWRTRGLDLLDLGFKKIYWIERRDKFAQAFSYAKAVKTDLWSKEFEVAAGYPDGVPMEVTQAEVAATLANLTKELDLGRQRFDGLVDRRFDYEDLVPDNCAAAVNAVLGDFGEPPAAPTGAGLRRQSADFDREQRERMRPLFPGM